MPNTKCRMLIPTNAEHLRRRPQGFGALGLEMTGIGVDPQRQPRIHARMHSLDGAFPRADEHLRWRRSPALGGPAGKFAGDNRVPRERLESSSMSRGLHLFIISICEL